MEPKRRRGGQPRKDPRQVRDSTLSVGVSLVEYLELRRRAAMLNLSMSDYLRGLLAETLESAHTKNPAGDQIEA